MMLELYWDAKGIKALAPFTRMDLSRRAHGIATSYEDGKVRTHLLNALRTCSRSCRIRACRPTTTDTERAIRDGIIPQRNSRHKTMNAKGRKTLSMLLTFALKSTDDIVDAITDPGSVQAPGFAIWLWGAVKRDG